MMTKVAREAKAKPKKAGKKTRSLSLSSSER
jgi:hypothetical protein